MQKLLLIDDEEGIRKVLAISLSKDGYQVLTAENGEAGLNIFKKELPQLVLTDIKMPGMDGIEVLKNIKKLHPETEVIIITGHGDMDTAIEALQHDASDFINKPIKDEALIIALKRAKERIFLKKKLKEYTDDLEHMIKIATEEVRRRVDFQNKLITSSNDGVVATDEEGKIVTYNQGAENIFGYTRSEVMRKMNITDLYPQDVADEFLQGFRKNKTIDSSWNEATILAKDRQEVPTRFSGSILFENDEVIGSVGFFRDLREVKKLQQELIKSERLAATGQTVAGLAHYIKNILIGLRGGVYVSNVALAKNDTEKLKSGWSMIERNVSRISDLVLNLLNYSKEHKPEYEYCYPNDIVEEVCSLLDPTAKDDQIEIIRNFDQSVGEVSLDSGAIHRTLLNLVSNAIDACLYDSNGKKRRRILVKTSSENNRMLRIDVSDNGNGMDEEVKSKLFTSFFSTKGGKGTGLGLLVTNKIVKENGGTIEVDSKKGEGSTFTIRLPYKNKEGNDDAKKSMAFNP